MIDFHDMDSLRAFGAMGLFVILLVAACIIAVVDVFKRRQREQTLAETREREIQMELKRLRLKEQQKRARSMHSPADGPGGLPA